MPDCPCWSNCVLCLILLYYLALWNEWIHGFKYIVERQILAYFLPILRIPILNDVIRYYLVLYNEVHNGFSGIKSW